MIWPIVRETTEKLKKDQNKVNKGFNELLTESIFSSGTTNNNLEKFRFKVLDKEFTEVKDVQIQKDLLYLSWLGMDDLSLEPFLSLDFLFVQLNKSI